MIDTFLTAPVYNFPNNYAGEAQELGVGNPGTTYGIWNAANSMTITFEQHYDQGDITYRVPVRSDSVSRTFITAGTRFSWIWERFKWRTVSEDALGQAGPFDVAIYSNIVSNRMYGPTIGCEQEFYIGTAGRIRASRSASRATFADGRCGQGRARPSWPTARLPRSCREPNTPSCRWLAATSRSPRYPIAGVQIRLGWNSLAFINTVNAPRPIAFNYGNLQNNNDFGVPPNVPAAAENHPIFERKALRYFDGITFGTPCPSKGRTL